MKLSSLRPAVLFVLMACASGPEKKDTPAAATTSIVPGNDITVPEGFKITTVMIHWAPAAISP